MSLILNNSNVSTKAILGKVFLRDQSSEHQSLEIDYQDFCSLIRYFLLNEDLKENDPRVKLINDIKKSKIISGLNPGKLGISLPVTW